MSSDSLMQEQRRETGHCMYGSKSMKTNTMQETGNIRSVDCSADKCTQPYPSPGTYDSPVAQMGLDGKKIFIEALNGFFLKYKVNPASPIQHPHFDLGLLSLFSWLRGLCVFTHAYWDRGKTLEGSTGRHEKEQSKSSHFTPIPHPQNQMMQL